MGVRNARQINGKYCGGMSVQQANLLMAIRNTDKVEYLKHKIYNFEYDLIMQSIEEERSIRNILNERGAQQEDYFGELRDYQTVGTAFMYFSPRSMIADGVGLGKTAEISALLNLLREKKEMTRFIIAVETSAIGQTQAEIMKFTGMRVIALPSEAVKMRRVIEKTDWRKVDGIVIKHSALRSDALSLWFSTMIDKEGLNRWFDTFILDESSVIKNTYTKMYDYTKNMCNMCKRVHFMNATVFETSLYDVYNQIDMMDNKLLPTKSYIQREYCTIPRKTYWIKDKATSKAVMKTAFDKKGITYHHQSEFKESIELVYFGRAKEEVGMDIPHIYRTYTIEPTPMQLNLINRGYSYNMVLNSPNLLGDATKEVPFDRQHVPKLDRLVSIVENEFADSSVMIYCWYTGAQEVIANELRNIGRKVCILNGEDTSADKDAKRHEMQRDFNNKTYDVIITNIKRSINLNAADVCIFYTIENNPAKMEQIGGRIDRKVDDSIKTFIMMVYKDTSEYDNLKQVAVKRDKDSRDLTIDAKTTISRFVQGEEIEI